MAINLSGLLGGLGIGAQQLASQMESERQFDINKRMAQQDFLSRLMKQRQDYELARDTAERADKALLRQERQQALAMANQTDIAVRGLIASDLVDEQKTIGELGSLGLTPERIGQIKEERAARRKLVEDALSAYGKEGIYRDVYGDPMARLAPSRVVAPTYVAPINVTPEQRINIFGGARTAIERSAPGQKMQEWGGQVRKLQALGLNPVDIERFLPKPGTVYEVGAETTQARSAMPGEVVSFKTPIKSPEGEVILPQGPTKDFGVISGLPFAGSKFKPVETLPSGERITRTILPSGEVQVTRKQPDVTEQYTSPEMEGLKAQAQRLHNQQFELLMDPTVQAAYLKNEGLRLKARLNLKELAWYDRLADAKVRDLLEQRGGRGVSSAAKNAKDAVDTLMSVSDAVKVYNAESLNAYRNADLWMRDRTQRNSELDSLERQVRAIETKADDAELKAAEARDTAYEATRQKSVELAKRLRSEAAELRQKIKAIRDGNASAMARYAGVSSFDPNQASASDLMSYIQNPGGNRMTELMGGGVQTTRSGQSGGTGTSPMVYAPNITVGGQGAVAGQGGAPGVAPGGGASPFGPGGPGFNDKVHDLSFWQAKFPKLSPARIRQVMDKNGNIANTNVTILAAENKKAKETEAKAPKEFYATAPNGAKILMLRYPDGRVKPAPSSYITSNVATPKATKPSGNKSDRKPFEVNE